MSEFRNQKDEIKKGISFNPMRSMFRRAQIKKKLAKDSLISQKTSINTRINIVGGFNIEKLKEIKNKSVKQNLSKLGETESEILKWLKASEVHLADFLLDPIDALYKSDLKIDKKVLRNLQQYRKIPNKSHMLPKNSQLRKIVIDVDKPLRKSLKKKGE